MPRLSQMLLGRSSYFKRYVDRVLNDQNTIIRYSPLAGFIRDRKVKWHYDRYRPWEPQFKDHHFGRSGPRDKGPFFQLKDGHWNVFKGDIVEILVGRDKGKRGIVNKIIKERNWVFVEGLNVKYEKISSDKSLPPLCNRLEEPLLVTTQVKLVDPKDNQGTEIEWRFSDEGERVRVSLRTGSIIPLPTGYEMGDDPRIIPEKYSAGDKDTKEDEVLEATFNPKVMSFEEEIMQVMGIKEERKRAPTYWY